MLPPETPQVMGYNATPPPPEKACSYLGSPAAVACLHPLPGLSRLSARRCRLHRVLSSSLPGVCLLYQALLAVSLPSETLGTQQKSHLSRPLPPGRSRVPQHLVPVSGLDINASRAFFCSYLCLQLDRFPFTKDCASFLYFILSIIPIPVFEP